MHPTIRTFPAGATRDSLGLVRLLWKVENDGIDLDRVEAITQAGEWLALAIKLGRCAPDSLGYRAFMGWAERAMDLLTGLEWSPEYGALVNLASRRVRGETPRPDDKRETKRKALAGRG